MSAEILARNIENQRDLLRQGAALVRPGGRLIYATCSLLAEENEARVEEFLQACGNFALLPMRELLPALLPASALGRNDYLVLTPHRHGTDGFFVAVLSHSV